MKKMYAIVANETNDGTIAEAVRRLFTKYHGKTPLDNFKRGLAERLRLMGNPVEVISVEKTPLTLIEEKYKGRAYRVIDDVVYQKDPEKS